MRNAAREHLADHHAPHRTTQMPLTARHSGHSLASPGSDTHGLLTLQQIVGNAATGRLLTDPAAWSTGPSETGRLQGTRSGYPINRFGAGEHRNLGDWATDRRYVKLGTKGYQLSYGEMVSMAADIFPSLDYMEDLANKPGKGPDTQEALDYARFVLIGARKATDAKTTTQQADTTAVEKAATAGKKHDAASYSKETVKAVDDMYYRLASDNSTHFVTPLGKDAEKAPQDRPHSAGESYRTYHEIAIERAATAGKAGQSDDAAMAAEGFAGHYLTDAVSSGHLRTPRLDIVAHWDPLNPGLVDRFADYLAYRVVEWIVTNKWYGKSVRPRYSFQSALDGINDALSSRPPLTMGVLVALAVHDYDNQKGLKVLVDGTSKTVFGDGNMKLGDTEAVGVAAVKAGVEDIQQAYQLGKAGKPVDEIIVTLLAGKKQYKAEALLPTMSPLAMRQPMPKWDVNSFEELLTDPPMVEALGIAVRGNISEIEKVAATQPEPGKTAIIEGFGKRVKKDPIGELTQIYDNDGSETEKFLSKFDAPKGF